MSANKHSNQPRPGQLEEEFRGVLRKMHDSMKTEESYIGWPHLLCFAQLQDKETAHSCAVSRTGQEWPGVIQLCEAQ